MEPRSVNASAFDTKTNPVAALAKPHRRRIPGLDFIGLMLTALFCLTAQAAPVTIPNGNFSDTANDGTIGGGVIGGSGSGTIGSGPWSGTYAGVLALLAPPELTIGSGRAQIGGLLGIDALGIVNNSGRIHQDSATGWIALRRYVLSADIDAGSALGVGALTSGNLGIALATGTSVASRVASSSSGGALLTLLGGTTYRLTVEHTTGGSVSGNIHVHLFAEPAGLLTVNLLGSIQFDNVSLSTHLLTQVPASIVPANPGPYTAVVGQQVAPALSVVVLDALGDPIPGVSVTFSAPATGASATIVPNPATTDANGVAQVTTTANTIAGSYQVIANVGGVPTPIIFDLVNHAGPAASVGSLNGSGQGAVTSTAFGSALGLQVLDEYGNPVPGVAVTFTAPVTGASASLVPGVAVTGPDGFATTSATANAIAGEYMIDVSVAGLGTVAQFALTNLLDPSITASAAGESGQNGEVGVVFGCALLIRVTDGVGDPMPGLAVDFVAPASGASAILTDGVSSGSSVATSTDVDGFAWVEATANGIAGEYTVGAQLRYSLAAPVEFRLRNLAEGDPLFANGFDGACIPPVGILEAMQRD